jgi:hypothetical protein
MIARLVVEQPAAESFGDADRTQRLMLAALVDVPGANLSYALLSAIVYTHAGARTIKSPRTSAGPRRPPREARSVAPMSAQVVEVAASSITGKRERCAVVFDPPLARRRSVIADNSGRIAGAIVNRGRQGHRTFVTADRRRSINVVVHPSIHLELARQRHQDLLAEAERQRAANGSRHAGVTPAARRSPRGANASPSAFNSGIASHSDVDVGLEC